MWHRRRSALRVYGSVAAGYIVAPHPPAHPAVPPPDREPLAEQFVAGRPTGHGSGQHEKAWRSSVADAFAEAPPLGETPVEVLLEFFLDPDQTGAHEPDLDNMVSATLDALDLDVARIVASKAPAPAGKGPGALIALRPAARP